MFKHTVNVPRKFSQEKELTEKTKISVVSQKILEAIEERESFVKKTKEEIDFLKSQIAHSFQQENGRVESGDLTVSCNISTRKSVSWKKVYEGIKGFIPKKKLELVPDVIDNNTSESNVKTVKVLRTNELN
jgi:hypothetical protein